MKDKSRIPDLMEALEKSLEDVKRELEKLTDEP